MNITFSIALVGGILTFLSPCVLPLLPVYLAYMTGTQIKSGDTPQPDRKRALFSALAFVVGFTVSFVLIGMVLFSLVAEVRSSGWFSKFAGVVLIVLGLHTLGLFKIRWLMQEKRSQRTISNTATLLGSLLMGVAFAVGWSPCIGPILSGILAMASTSESTLRAALLMTTYSLGLGIPFILAALLTERVLRVTQKLKKHLGLIEKISGCLILLIGIGLLFVSLDQLSSWFVEQMPWLENLISVEDKMVGEQ